MAQSDLDEIEKIKKLVIISLFSDDDLMSVFVVKGGNALNILYNVNNRGSMDVDVSMESDFLQSVEIVRQKLETALKETFLPEGYHIFDVTLTQQPDKKTKNPDFWGGYKLEFKIIRDEKYQVYKDDLNQLRRNLLQIHGKGKFKVDISKHEYCGGKVDVELDGYTVFCYTPVMIVYEKLRALCQQVEKYSEIIKTKPKPRARDFFDIHSIIEWEPSVESEIFDSENLKTLIKIFEIKKVPMDFLGKIENTKEFHKLDFNSVVETVTSTNIHNYDYYFNYTVEICKRLTDLLDKTTSSA